jgi:hypothetical protein
MSVSTQFGVPYSTAIIGFIGLMVMVVTVKYFQGLLDWIEKFFFIISQAGIN